MSAIESSNSFLTRACVQAGWPTSESRSQSIGGPRAVPTYFPIRDYALIGDCHGCALVSRAGSIDWCAFGRFDAPPVFCRLLDAGKGGFLSVTPVDTFEVERSYLEGTNILRTVFTTSTGKASVTDYSRSAVSRARVRTTMSRCPRPSC